MTEKRVLALVPVRSFHNGKSRLAGALTDAERSQLIVQMLDHVLDCLVQVERLDCRVVSTDSDVAAHVRRRGGKIAPFAGNGLNPVLHNAAAILGNGRPILTIHADLPLLVPDDVEALIELANLADVVIATDQAARGTNALLQSTRCQLPFLFGPGSLARFAGAAQQYGASVSICHRPGLAFDIDTPKDLAEWRKNASTAAFPCSWQMRRDGLIRGVPDLFQTSRDRDLAP